MRKLKKIRKLSLMRACIKIRGEQDSWKEQFWQFLEDKSVMEKNCDVEVDVNLESGEEATVAPAEVAMAAPAGVVEAWGGARPWR